MERPIVGFGVDEEGVPIAILSCGHPQHVRHNPPFFNRPWVLTEAGRAAMLGQSLNCVRCDRLELPDRFIARDRTPIFTETAMPLRLRQGHRMSAGVWGEIRVEAGHLRYRVDSLPIDVALSPGEAAAIPPAVVFSIGPAGDTRFFLEVYWTAYSRLASRLELDMRL